MRDPKNQIFIAVLILVGAVIYYWNTSVYTSYNEKISSLVQEQASLASKLISVKQKAATKEQLEAEFKELQIKNKKVGVLLPEKKSDESFLNQVHGAAQLTNSVVIKITPLGAQDAEYYQTNNYSIEVESSFHGMGRFFAQ
ncbi:MAG: type 4a pilus biogenesis protein PilO, partial [candidate division Zixibacteria bacterium]